MVYETLLVVHTAGVSRLTLNRPPVNAVPPALMRAVLTALDDLEAREATRCIVLTGAGTKAFSAGADLSGGPRAGDEAARFPELGRRVVDRVETIGKPVIAAIRGWCIGGGFAIAMACDNRKSTRLNSSHSQISYAVFCLKKKKNKTTSDDIRINKNKVQ